VVSFRNLVSVYLLNTDRSLVSIDEYNRLRMHDLIQDMGREVVREVSPLEPGKRSRIWNHEDVIEVLTESSVRAMCMLFSLFCLT
jgi:hypothetical protein